MFQILIELKRVIFKLNFWALWKSKTYILIPSKVYFNLERTLWKSFPLDTAGFIIYIPRELLNYPNIVLSTSRNYKKPKKGNMSS